MAGQDRPQGTGRRRSVGGIDEVDREIVELLRRDGRAPVSDVAASVNVSRSTAHERLGRLLADGIITGFHAAVDHEALGDGFAAVVFIDIDQHAWEEVRAALLAIDGIELVLFLTGRHDLLVLVRCDGLATLRDTILVGIQGIAGVRSSETAVVLGEIWPTRQA